MKKYTVLFIILLLPSSVIAADGTFSIKSDFSVAETANRFQTALQENGLRLFARVDHAGNARDIELELRPTEVIVFGNPKIGTLLMQCEQKVAFDLPQRALFWQDEEGQVWLSYNDPNYLKIRYGIEGCDPALEKVSKVLSLLSIMATSK